VEAPRYQQSQSGRIQVLLVEDDVQVRDLLTKQLELMGCAVCGTSEAGAFLTKLVSARCAYDIAIVDLKLPGLQGDDIIPWLRQSEDQEFKSLPILVVTGQSHRLAEALHSNDANIAILSKPYRTSELWNAVTQLFAQGPRH
jgi:DNA-binding response OmpR family regulator